VAAADSGRIRVRFSDGSSTEARIVGRDPSSDLAVLRVDRDDLVPATFASDDPRVGQTVLAVGSPLGLDGTVTQGIVSALDRPVRLGEGDATGQGAVIDAVQTDAGINPGNSGGPLVDTNGHVVGINTAIASVSSGIDQSGNIGVGFAIPAGDAVEVADELIADGSAEHAALGVSAGNRGERRRRGAADGAPRFGRRDGRPPGGGRRDRPRRPRGGRRRQPHRRRTRPRPWRAGAAHVSARRSQRHDDGHAGQPYGDLVTSDAAHRPRKATGRTAAAAFGLALSNVQNTFGNLS
jgi:hypothetical protein